MNQAQARRYADIIDNRRATDPKLDTPIRRGVEDEWGEWMLEVPWNASGIRGGAGTIMIPLRTAEECEAFIADGCNHWSSRYYRMSSQTLKLRRQRLGMSQAALAQTLNVAVTTVARWEQGRVEIPGYLHLALMELERQRVR